jgi:hypothetical protein
MSNQKYTPSNQTNIEKNWVEVLGYVRASEQPDIKAKHDMYKTYGYDITKEVTWNVNFAQPAKHIG